MHIERKMNNWYCPKCISYVEVRSYKESAENNVILYERNDCEKCGTTLYEFSPLYYCAKCGKLEVLNSNFLCKGCVING